MLKLEKIITLFKLVYLIKKDNLNNKKFKIVSKRYAVACFANAVIKTNKIYIKKNGCVSWFVYNFNFYKKNKKLRFLYLCIKKEKFSSAIYIYYKNVLLFNLNRRKKVIKKRRKLEKFRAKGSVKIKKKFHFKNFIKSSKKNKLFKKNKLCKIKFFFKWLFKIVLKLIFKFKLNVIKICVFKSKGIKYRFLKSYTSFKIYRFRRKFFKLVRNLFLFLKLSKINNLKIIYTKSTNFSHSKKLLKLKKKRS